MAKKKKKTHVIEYDPKLDHVIPDEIKQRPAYRRHRDSFNNIGVTPSRRSPTQSHKIVVTTDDEIPFQEVEQHVLDIIDEQASRRNVRLLPIMGVRDRKPCEKNKAARRAAAFASGSAGKRRTTKPRRRYQC